MSWAEILLEYEAAGEKISRRMKELENAGDAQSLRLRYQYLKVYKEIRDDMKAIMRYV